MAESPLQTLGQIISRCPSKYANIKIDQVYSLKDVHPGAYRLVLLACTKEQEEFLVNLWGRWVHVDLPVRLALKSFIRYGEIQHFMDLNAQSAKKLLRIASAAASEALLYNESKE